MRAAKEMVAKVESQGGSDNTSIIIICLNQVIISLSVSLTLLQLSKPNTPGKGLHNPLRKLSASLSSSSLSTGSLSPNTSFTEENLRVLRRGTGSWQRVHHSLPRGSLSPGCSFRGISPSVPAARERDDST
jgi:hypothetical protein